jgi:hypothetical protein
MKIIYSIASFLLILIPLFGQHSTTAYCWDSPVQNVSNIIPMCWVATYSDPPKFYQITDINGIAAHLNSMPQGKRCLAIWNTHVDIVNNPADQLKDSVTQQVKGYIDTMGTFHAYPNIWWENGANYIYQIHDNFFRALASVNAPLDIVVMDFEFSISNWMLENTVNSYLLNTAQKDSVLIDLYEAIMSDSRFSAVQAALGFSDLMCVKNWWLNDSCYLKFNSYWQQKRTEYLNHAIVNPLYQYYPTAKISNFQDVHYSKKYPVPDIYGHRGYLWGMGAHTGTHQAGAYYGALAQITGPRPPAGVFSFPFSAFNALLYETNSMKSTKKSHPAPLIGWIAFPTYQNAFLNPPVAYENSSYFFENIFHLLLSGSEDILYWNPVEPNGPPSAIHQQQAQQISNTLSEFDSFWNNSKPDTSLFYPPDTITTWNSPYVLTGMSSDSLILWRLSPRLDSVFLHPTDFLTGISPLTFDFYGTQLNFPIGSIISPLNSISDSGLWIVYSKKITTNISENSDSNNLINAFPNPFHDEFYISCNETNHKDIKITIYNSEGDLINPAILPVGNMEKIIFKGYSSGVYFLKIQSNFQTTVKKIIKH